MLVAISFFASLSLSLLPKRESRERRKLLLITQYMESLLATENDRFLYYPRHSQGQSQTSYRLLIALPRLPAADDGVALGVSALRPQGADVHKE